MIPKSEQPTSLARHGKTIVLIMLLCMTIPAFAQNCDCPPPGTCAPCRGGLSKLTLRYGGLVPAWIIASDQSGEIFRGFVGGGDTFTLAGRQPNDKFQGPNISLGFINSPSTSIGTGCGSDVEVGDRFGIFFTVVSGESKDGGALCCRAPDRDTTPPDIEDMPTNRTVNLSAPGSSDCKAIVRWNEPRPRDACTVVSFTSNFHSGDAFPLGPPTRVTYTAIDKAGNKRERSFTVTVVDDVPPVINCPGSLTVTATEGACTMAVNWTPPSVSDCSAVTLTPIGNRKPGDLLPVGETTKITYSARDATGRTSECTFDIHVIEGAPPTFVNCPADITVEENSACEKVVTWTPPTVTSTCSKTVVQASRQPGSKFPLGATPVEYTVTDTKGNKSVCSFTVHVTTSATPVVTGCPAEPIRVQSNELGEAVVTWPEPRATIACGEVPVRRSHAPGSTFNIGTTAVVYTFGQGDHTATCSVDVIVAPPDIAIEIGKALTPNGDGIHDQWQITLIEKYKNNAVLVIDRWGNKVYEANGYDNERIAWDGHNLHGVKVPTGTYFYTVEVRVQGIVWKRKGSLEVIQP
jgi:gliding motility-associated-like protein